MLQNRLYINLGAGSLMTGSEATLLAAARIGGAIGGTLYLADGTRAMTFIPIAIGVAGRVGYHVISVTLPTAFLIAHVYVLPFNSTPAAPLDETERYSVVDSFRHDFTMMVIAWLGIILRDETQFRVLDIAPNGVFGRFQRGGRLR